MTAQRWAWLIAKTDAPDDVLLDWAQSSVVRSINPVFEIEGAHKDLAGVTIDGEALSESQYAWDGSTLWLKATIGSGANIRLNFR